MREIDGIKWVDAYKIAEHQTESIKNIYKSSFPEPRASAMGLLDKEPYDLPYLSETAKKILGV